LFLRDAGDTEVGGFAVSTPDDLLLVTDVRLIRQLTSAISVKFADNSVAEFFDEQVDAGMKPEQFARIWVHTHPGNSPHPSSVDEETFARVFGRSDWAVMFILARDGSTYARLRFNAGPGGDLVIPVAVDYCQPFAASDQETWTADYLRHVVPEDRVERRLPDTIEVRSTAAPESDSPGIAHKIWDEFFGEPDERLLVEDDVRFW